MNKGSIFISDRGDKNIIYPNNDEKKYIKCGIIDKLHLDFLDFFGYNIDIIYDSEYDESKLAVNDIISSLTKHAGPIKGHCIIYDNDNDLSLDDLTKMLIIVNYLPIETDEWLPEPLIQDISINKFNNIIFSPNSSRENIMDIINIKKLSAVEIISENERQIIWNNVKKYYVDKPYDPLISFNRKYQNIEDTL